MLGLCLGSRYEMLGFTDVAAVATHTDVRVQESSQLLGQRGSVKVLVVQVDLIA